MPSQWKWKQFCKQAATNGIFPASGKAQGIISRPIEISWLQTSALVMSRHKDHPGKCLGIFTLGHVYVVSYALQNALGHLWESLERSVGPGSLVVTALGWGHRPGFPELCRPHLQMGDRGVSLKLNYRDVSQCCIRAAGTCLRCFCS